MTDREKLIELVNDILSYLPWGQISTHTAQEVADHLLDNDVTFATDNNVGSKWISVKERLPDEDGSYIVRTTTGAVTTARFYVGKTYPPTHFRPTEYRSPTKWQSNRNVTHWMPLPEAPNEKGNNYEG